MRKINFLCGLLGVTIMHSSLLYAQNDEAPNTPSLTPTTPRRRPSISLHAPATPRARSTDPSTSAELSVMQRTNKILQDIRQRIDDIARNLPTKGAEFCEEVVRFLDTLSQDGMRQGTTNLVFTNSNKESLISIAKELSCQSEIVQLFNKVADNERKTETAKEIFCHLVDALLQYIEKNQLKMGGDRYILLRRLVANSDPNIQITSNNVFETPLLQRLSSVQRQYGDQSLEDDEPNEVNSNSSISNLLSIDNDIDNEIITPVVVSSADVAAADADADADAAAADDDDLTIPQPPAKRPNIPAAVNRGWFAGTLLKWLDTAVKSISWPDSLINWGGIGFLFGYESEVVTSDNVLEKLADGDFYAQLQRRLTQDEMQFIELLMRYYANELKEQMWNEQSIRACICDCVNRRDYTDTFVKMLTTILRNDRESPILQEIPFPLFLRVLNFQGYGELYSIFSEINLEHLDWGRVQLLLTNMLQYVPRNVPFRNKCFLGVLLKAIYGDLPFTKDLNNAVASYFANHERDMILELFDSETTPRVKKKLLKLFFNNTDKQEAQIKIKFIMTIMEKYHADRESFSQYLSIFLKFLEEVMNDKRPLTQIDQSFHEFFNHFSMPYVSQITSCAIATATATTFDDAETVESDDDREYVQDLYEAERRAQALKKSKDNLLAQMRSEYARALNKVERRAQASNEFSLGDD